jgi:hypothetical protein
MHFSTSFYISAQSVACLLGLVVLCAGYGVAPVHAGQGATLWLSSTLVPQQSTLQQHAKASAMPLLKLLAQPAPKPVALPAFVERLAPVLPTGLRRLESHGMQNNTSPYLAW